MRKLMLGVALLGGACGQPSQTIKVGTTTRPEPSTSTSTEAPTTTAVVTTSTTEPVPEPVVEPEPEPVYVAPVTPRRTSTTVAEYYEPPSPQGRSTRGDTPPEYIKQCESGGSYTAVNPNGHYGAWQFSQQTWESVGGSGRPDYATPAEQDMRAAILWDGGRGASHWECA